MYSLCAFTNKIHSDDLNGINDEIKSQFELP